MNSPDLKRLVVQIARIAEKGYRRGFQHGYLASRGELGAPAPSPDEVADWRFADHAATHAVGAPGTVWAGRRGKLIHRLSCEADDLDLIRGLLAGQVPDCLGPELRAIALAIAKRSLEVARTGSLPTATEAQAGLVFQLGRLTGAFIRLGDLQV